MKFIIEQIALAPRDPVKSLELMLTLGLTDWTNDKVKARGYVWPHQNIENEATLSFNYQATSSDVKPLELEMLRYDLGHNWLNNRRDSLPVVSHIGMHCSAEELETWREKLNAIGIQVAQEVFTYSHDNPVIAGKRWYHYTIFSTAHIIGCDIKFIVRKDAPPQ